MRGYNDTWNYLNKFIENKIKEVRPEQTFYLGEITETDGYFVSLKVLNPPKDTAMKTLEKIPIVQNPYISSPSKVGDTGLVLMVGDDIGQLLTGLPSSNIQNMNFKVFIPFCKQGRFKGARDTAYLESEKVKIKAGEAHLESQKVEIKADTPISIGSKKTLGEILSELVDTLSSAKTISAYNGAMEPLDPATLQKLTQINLDIKNNFK